MLLHVLAAAFGVDRSLHVFVGGGTLQAMQDAIVVGLGDFQNRFAAQRAGVVRLTTRCRIERGAIEQHADVAAGQRTHLENLGLELQQSRIFQIQTRTRIHGGRL